MSYPNAWGLRYEEVQSLTWLAYRGQGEAGRWRFPNSGSEWTVEDPVVRGSFRAIVAHGRMTVLSIAGTDDLGDWVDNVAQGTTGVSVQYLRAVHLANSKSPDVVVGHSLGGGMASYVAVYTRRRAATINPAPLNINLVSAAAIRRNGNLVINYVAPGEVLDLLDSGARSMSKVGTIHRVRSRSAFNPLSRHSIANLEGFVMPERI